MLAPKLRMVALRSQWQFALRSQRQSVRRSSLFRRMVDRVVDYYEGSSTRVVSGSIEPEALAEAFGGLSLDDGPSSDEGEVLRCLETYLERSPRTGHKYFLNQLYGGPSEVTVAAEFALAATNTNVHTYEVAPILTLMEEAVVKKIGGMFFPDSAVDGLTTPGGSVSNLYAMHLARCRADPEIRRRGPGPRPLVAFVSEDAHYSFKKAARVLGLGDDNVVAIPTDKVSGAMDSRELEKAIQATQGKQPFFIGSTAGTTIRGAFDDISAVAEISEKFGLWHHVDAAWGGPVILSSKQERRDLLDGVDRADSVAFNAHKILNVALPCALFLTPHVGALKDANATAAPYLFQGDKPFADRDIGDKSLQCGRKGDALKLWFALKFRNLSKTLDTSMDLATIAGDFIRTHSHLDLVCDPSFANVCFRPSDSTVSLPAIKERLMLADYGAMIGVTTHHHFHHRHFFRLVITQGDHLSPADVADLLDRIAAFSTSSS